MWLGVLGALSGCGLQVVTLYVDDHQDAVLPGIPPVELPEEGEPAGAVPEELAEALSVPLDLSWELPLADIVADQGIAEGDLSTAVLMQLELEVVSPKDEHLGFLDDLRLTVDADDLGVQMLAELGFGDTDGQNSRLLDASRAELVEYLMSPGLVVLTEATGEIPEEDIVLRLSYVVEIGVTLQGVTSRM